MKPFKTVPLVEDCIELVTAAAYRKSDSSEDELFIGTDEGSVLKYGVSASELPEMVANSGRLLGSLRASSRKIERLGILADVILFQCEGTIQMAEATLLSSPKYLCKGSNFAVRTGAKASQPAVCISYKKKLYIYEGPGLTFVKELPLRDTITALVWHEFWICVANDKEYMLVEAASGNASSIFPIDSGLQASICCLKDENEVVLLGLDFLSIFYSLQAKQPSFKNTIQWPQNKENKVMLAACPPYIIGASPSGQLEVHSIRDQKLCQRTSISGFRLMSDDGGRVIVATENQISCLLPVPFDTQILKLLHELRVSEAWELLNANYGPSDPKRQEKLSFVHKLSGWALFKNLQFGEAFKHFLYGELDPCRLLGFWNHCLPEGWLQNFTEEPLDADLAQILPGTTSISELIENRLNEKKMEQERSGTKIGTCVNSLDAYLDLANYSLITFLLKEREVVESGNTQRFDKLDVSQILTPANKSNRSSVLPAGLEGLTFSGTEKTESSEGESFSNQRQAQLLTLIDSLLVKLIIDSHDDRWTYLEDCAEMSSSFFHFIAPDLIEHHRYDILSLILKTNRKYREACAMLRSVIETNDTKLKSRLPEWFNPTKELASILMCVSSQYSCRSLVLQYAPIVVENLPRDGLAVLEAAASRATASEIRQLHAMLEQMPLSSHMEDIHGEFLSFLICETVHGNSENTTKLALLLIDALPTNHLPPYTEDGTSAVDKKRTKLVRLLSNAEAYDEERVATELKAPDLLNERAMVEGHRGNHRTALYLMVKEIRDLRAAEAYCRRCRRSNGALTSLYEQPVSQVDKGRKIFEIESVFSEKCLVEKPTEAEAYESETESVTESSTELESSNLLSLLLEVESFPL